MFDLIRYGICHPKFLGKFIVEKTYKIVLVISIMFVLLISTIFGINVSNTYLTKGEAEIVNSVLVSKTDLTYNDSKLTFTNEVNEEILGIKVILDNDGVVDSNSLGYSNLIFSNDSVKFTMGDRVIKTKLYSDFGNYHFNVNNKQTVEDGLNFFGFLEEAFSLSYVLIYTQNTLMQVVEIVFSAMLLALFIFLLTGKMNPQVKGVMRVRLLLTCFVSYIFLYWLYFVFDQNMFIYMLTYVIPYLYFIIALANILRISKVVK